MAETNTSGLSGVTVLTTAPLPNDCLVIPPSMSNYTYAFLTIVRTTIETQPSDLVAAVQVMPHCVLLERLHVLVLYISVGLILWCGCNLSMFQSDWATATALAANGTLRSTHIAEWAETVWPAGFGTDRVRK